jgi:hypothetical protein
VTDTEKIAVQNALAMHRGLARELRIGMRSAIQSFAKNMIGDEIHENDLQNLTHAVNRTTIFVDEPLDPTPPKAIENCGDRVWLQCQDFAGNFPLPFFGDRRPSLDYYVSNLNTYNFVISDLSRNLNFVYNYDERGMGKDKDAMCSLRMKHILDSIANVPLNKRPEILFLILDNCVGQNKSQVIY